MAAEQNPSSAVAFFDVDGTLVWSDWSKRPQPGQEGADAGAMDASAVEQERPSDATYDAIRRMRAAGHRVFICTGRPFFLITKGVRALEPDGYIAEAGAYVRVGDEVIYDEHIPYDLVMEVAQRFVEVGLDVDFESNELDVGLYPTGGVCPFPGCLTAHTVEEFRPYAERFHFAKCGTRQAPGDKLELLRPFLEEHFELNNMQFGVYDIALKGLDKGRAIQRVLDYLGHGREHTFAFGDSENDLSMAPAVGTFVAMGNALPQVKEAADYVTCHAREDGVVRALEHFGLA